MPQLISTLACLLCDTPAPRALGTTVTADGQWTCVRCQQVWSRRRLDTVSAYQEWCRG